MPSTKAACLLNKCANCGWHIALAESLTGGLLADAFVSIPGASKVLLGSAVTYDIHAKAKLLGVDFKLLKSEGAVHPQVAMQMASGTAKIYRGSGWQYESEKKIPLELQEESFPVIGLSTTGVAGPGPDGSKPAGLVYVGMYVPKVLVDTFNRNDFVKAVSNIPSVKNVYLDYKSGALCSAFELRFNGSRSQVRVSTVNTIITIAYTAIVELNESKNISANLAE